MIVLARSEPARPSQRRSETFTGTVWANVVLPARDGVTVNDVFFEPGARTYWHRHEVHQVLQVTHGRGFVCSRDGAAHALKPGDVVQIPAGEEHWHGAAPDSYLLHVAISVGKTEWLEAVADEDYAVGCAAGAQGGDA